MMELDLGDVQGWTSTHKIISLSAIVAASLALYNLGLSIYRLFFSNISGFPGPKIAAATYLYEFYYDWLLSGKYIFVIEEMHKKYGSAAIPFLWGLSI